MKLTCVETYLYYDGPQVQRAEDEDGIPYIVVMVPKFKNRHYVAVRVSEIEMDNLLRGDVDLLTIMSNDIDKPWYLVNIFKAECIDIERQYNSIVDSPDFLPEEGLYMTDFRDYEEKKGN